jgi:ATP-binding cassette subfamily G (WHITE) protein 2 (SNQ2)
MDVLAQRKTGGQLSGQILIIDKPFERHFNEMCGYVEQSDTHFDTSTVEEAVAFSAHLRLPATMPEADRLDIVRQTLEEVGLTELRGLQIGTLSPALPKLVSIAVELVTRPSVL